ncbi:phage tail terminator protein [Wielerella bovis]|uniref:phage tail terminator protein n=1 Tax=Wielerella bovis TaxID=2917790 RepID=UPI002019FF71|nr:hypothetical protein [Wielerella bovis]MCG7655942.1 hypothetical protein [Wielerella bovis]MCG7655965.1 hypothetical protein [Wielerella bovis]MCG7658141.1 hypothetical protein [Wielerella bovis]MCG7658190.1 hypothetical protein [Wielerella bovis]ULJ63284.1 hypothetical protein MIS46_04335 [Wielerella bovis]
MEKHHNYLAVYPYILARLKTVQGVKTVKEASDLAELVKRKSAPLDGAVYVVYGGNDAEKSVNQGKFQTETLTFTFLYCGKYLSGSSSNLYEVGKVLTAIQTAFQGWQPEAHLTDSEFKRIHNPPIEYHDGFAFYPIAFSVDVSIIA